MKFEYDKIKLNKTICIKLISEAGNKQVKIVNIDLFTSSYIYADYSVINRQGEVYNLKDILIGYAYADFETYKDNYKFDRIHDELENNLLVIIKDMNKVISNAYFQYTLKDIKELTNKFKDIIDFIKSKEI